MRRYVKRLRRLRDEWQRARREEEAWKHVLRLDPHPDGKTAVWDDEVVFVAHRGRWRMIP